VLRIAPYEPEIVSELERALNLPQLIARILASRGVRTAEEAARFLSPRIEHLSDPFLLPDVEAAIDTVIRAIRAEKRIGLFGDYDADGVTSTALMVNFLAGLGIEPEVYLPARAEGYGLNIDAVRTLKAKGVDLLVCLDCGSSNATEIGAARDLGMEVVVLDHHEVADPCPEGAAVVNPKRKGAAFPTRELAACGVTFFFLVALRRTMDRQGLLKRPVNLKRELDLVALGTVADMVPPTGDNRILVKFGMETMQKQPRTWLASFFRQNLSMRRRIDEYGLSFIIIPRINAAGRVAHPMAALDFLRATGEEASAGLLTALDKANRERQGMEEVIIQEARSIMEENGLADRSSLVLSKEDWPLGVIGIAAQKLAEAHGKPCIIFTRVDGTWKGSARGVPGLDLHGTINTLSALLTRFGGHTRACGLSLDNENLSRFPLAFEEAVKKALLGKEKEIVVDGVLRFEELTRDLVEHMELLGPFGMGNPRPSFLLAPTAISVYRYTLVKLTDERKRVWYGNIRRSLAVPEGPGVQVVACPSLREEMGEKFIHFSVSDFVTSESTVQN